jgi:hypothetical protein
VRISRRRTSYSSKLSPFSSYQQRSIQLFHTTYDLTSRLLQPSPQSQYFSNLKLNQYPGKHGPIDFVWTPSAQPMSTKLIQHSYILPPSQTPLTTLHSMVHPRQGGIAQALSSIVANDPAFQASFGATNPPCQGDFGGS